MKPIRFHYHAKNMRFYCLAILFEAGDSVSNYVYLSLCNVENYMSVVKTNAWVYQKISSRAFPSQKV